MLQLFIISISDQIVGEKTVYLPGSACRRDHITKAIVSCSTEIHKNRYSDRHPCQGKNTLEMLQGILSIQRTVGLIAELKTTLTCEILLFWLSLIFQVSAH